MFGNYNEKVLIQEFLEGNEYVIDSVSVNGQHKCVAIWEYDKRPANGGQFVYFGMRLFETENGIKESKLVEYTHKVLDSLGINNGPSHAEVMWLQEEDQPCLVEVGARPHGGEGTFVELAQPAVGYTQLSVMIDALEDKGSRHSLLPTRPTKLNCHSIEVNLVSHEDGVLTGYPGLEMTKRLKSYLSAEMKLEKDDFITKTIDFMTTPGSIMLSFLTIISSDFVCE